MGLEFLTLILLWCNLPNQTSAQIMQCRAEKIECLHNLKKFSNDDFVIKCLLGSGG